MNDGGELVVEQRTVRYHGSQKNGGSLLNKINSVSRSNSSYSGAISRGTDLLSDVGYPGF